MPSREARTIVWASALLVTVVMSPRPLLATLSPEEAPAAVLEDERERLADVRERLVRREAMRRALTSKIETAGESMDGLRTRRQRSEQALQQAREEALAVERRLSGLVARLAARKHMVEQQRDQAAHALANLAGLSRQVELDPAVRARLLAVSPLMLERLRAADADLADLRDERERILARQRAVREQTRVLLAKRRQLERERSLLQNRREAQVRELEAIEAELSALQHEEQTLARRVLATELRADRQPDQPALDAGGLTEAAVQLRPEATVKGVAVPSLLAAAADPMRPNPSQVSLAALSDGPGYGVGALSSAYALVPSPPPAKPVGRATKPDLEASASARDRISFGRNAAADIASLEPAVGGNHMLALSPARIVRPDAPIMPVPGQVVSRFGADVGGRETAAIAIAAVPGQAVAAPADGRVVFAGAFRSYGLLLIIEHGREYHTLLWGFSRLDVDVGDDLRIGQVVGVMGVDAGRAPELHVELRRHGSPVNPLPWLAASSSKVRG